MSTPIGTPAKAPKAMSSRLLTMKFMQRAAASSPIASPSTPEQPSPKRQKTGDSSPVEFDVNALANHQAITAAIASEEAKRQIALDKQAAEAGDTRWVLNFEQDSKRSNGKQKNALQIVQTGFASIDRGSVGSFKSYDEDIATDQPVMVGRKSFGKFNRVLEAFISI